MPYIALLLEKHVKISER